MTDDAPQRLSARPGDAPPAGPVPGPGLHALRLDPRRDAWVAVPSALATPAPLLVLLHGAGSSGRAMLELLGPVADAAGALVLAPDSRDSTWDVIVDRFGPDVRFIDAALARVFGMVAVDPARLVVAGFSDGASYALSLGLPNGDLFSHVVALSPGFVVPRHAHGRPPVYVSHGRSDPVLPIDRCSRRIVPALRRLGHDVHYVEFDGGHGVPPDIARDALRWVAETR